MYHHRFWWYIDGQTILLDYLETRRNVNIDHRSASFPGAATPRWIFDENWKLSSEEMQKKNMQTYCSINVIYFIRSIWKKKKSVYILKPCREIGQSLEESLGGKLVEWTIDVEIYADSRGCYPPRPSPGWITASSISIILHIILNLIQWLLIIQ